MSDDNFNVDIWISQWILVQDSHNRLRSQRGTVKCKGCSKTIISLRRGDGRVLQVMMLNAK